MRTLFLLFLLVLGSNPILADDPPPTPQGIIILKAVAGYPAAATTFTAIQWVNTDGGYVLDQSGGKLPFLNIGIGRIIYFDPIYYDELDHNQFWLNWRAGLQSRETVLTPPNSVSIHAADLPHLQQEEQDLQQIIAEYPSGKPALDPFLSSLEDASTKLSNGMVLQNGKWMAATEATSDAVPTIGQSEKLTTFTTKDGKKFENAKITVTATGISVITPDGGASVAFDRLPDNLAPFPEATRSQIHDGQTAAAEAKAEETKANAPPPPESSSLGSLWASLSSFMESMLHRVQAFFSSSTSSSTPAAPAAPIEPAPAAPAAPATVTPPTPTNATATPAPVNLPTSGELVNLVSGRLVSADGNSVTLPPSTIQYYAIYYSAQWCPPCHAFSPRLVSWYNKFKPAHPNFELIFVSEDHDEAAMFNYMKEMSMPWPAFRFDRLMHDGNGTFQGPGIEQYAGKGIPDLVLVDATGKVLSDSYHGDQYFGPESVVDDINKIVGGSAPVPLGQQRPALPHSTPTLITSQGSTAGLGFPSGT